MHIKQYMKDAFEKVKNSTDPTELQKFIDEMCHLRREYAAIVECLELIIRKTELYKLDCIYEKRGKS